MPADLDQMAGEGERADVVDHLVQAVDQQQEEIRDAGDRTGDVAQRHDPGPVAMLALPGGEEGNAAPGGISSQRAAHVEMAAALALARLRVALAQAAGDLADQRAHLLDLPRLDPGERRVAQNLVAQVFGLLAPIKQQRLRDGIAHGFAQAIERGLQPLGQRRIGRGQSVEVVAQALDAHGIEDTTGKDAALGEIADVGQ